MGKRAAVATFSWTEGSRPFKREVPDLILDERPAIITLRPTESDGPEIEVRVKFSREPLAVINLRNALADVLGIPDMEERARKVDVDGSGATLSLNVNQFKDYIRIHPDLPESVRTLMLDAVDDVLWKHGEQPQEESISE